MEQLIINPDSEPDWVIEVSALMKDHGDKITPEKIVKHARNKASALHKMFTWDDTKAAQAYRLMEAGSIMRRYYVSYRNKDGEEIRIKKFISVTVQPDEEFPRLQHVYKTIESVLESPEHCAEMLMNAKRELVSFRRKYSVLQELASLIQVIDEVLGIPQTVL